MIEKITKASGYFSAFTLALLVVFVLYDAIARYFFSAGSIAIQELQWHLFDVVILIGIGYTLHLGAHVRVDIFYDRYSEKTKHLINMIGSIFFVLPFSFLIIYVGYDFVMLSFEQLEASSNPGGLQWRFIVKSLMPIAFLLLSLQAVCEVIVSFKEYRGSSK
ncbi:MAG: TRAP transporter small permease subunit [Campylobacterota bacterium]|nr:TRAP transporter small permease subunit [Campylobacterota bacterium]